MRRIVTQTILLLSIFYLCSTQPFVFGAPQPFFQPIQPSRSLQVMAHRGASQAAPENTLPALALAVEMGFEWAEIDIRLTQDGKHVLLHDNTLKDTTNGHGHIDTLPLEVVKQMDAGSWFAKRFAGTRVPTLEEALVFAKDKINLYIDCKAVDPTLLAQEILTQKMENQVAVYDNIEPLKIFNKAAKGKIPLMAKCHNLDELKTLIDELKIAIIEVNYEDITHELVNTAHKAGVLVQVKALDQDDIPDVWNMCLKVKADFVQTDRPDEVQAAYFHSIIPKPACWISAHRGVSVLAPENSIPSILKTVALGCDFVEIDVRTSSDGQLVLMHDGKVDRTTSLEGALNALTFDVLRGVSVGAWFGKPFKEEKIPTLAEAIQAIDGHVRIYLDNKETKPAQLIAELDKYGVTDNVVVYDGNLEEMDELRRLKPTLKLMPPLESIEQIATLSERLHPYAFDTKWSSLSPELIAACHKLGIKVFSDAMGLHETQEHYLKAIGWGIDLIQTDHPLSVQRALEIAAKKK